MEVSSLFFGPLGTTFLIGITILLLLIWNSSRKHMYWKKKGVPFVKPFPLVGNLLQDIMNKQHELDLKRCEELGPIWGYYEGNTPAIAVADPEFLKYITVKDFAFFANHRTLTTGDKIFDSIVINLDGEDWKRVRTIITPAFTTGKLKSMLGIFQECSMTLVKNFRSAADKGEPILVKKLYGAMTMDVIASSAFSTKLDSHNDPENKFVQMSRKVFDQSFTWKMGLFIIAPNLSRWMGLSFFGAEVMSFFKEVTEQIIKERRRLRQTRNDFLQLLMDTADEMSQEQNWEETEADNDLINNYGSEVAATKVYRNSVTKNLSIDEMVAQCILFFIGGYETTGQTLTFVSYCLALNTDIQEKARKVIRECLQETNGEITYEALQNMRYLDNIISETLRMYSVATRMERKTEADYKLGNTGITIEKGMVVTIPIHAIHKNPKYYPNPDKFDPDRFTPEERVKRNPYAYIPFGAGPRNCLGMRFALLEIKMCLVYVLSNFNIKTCSRTEIPLKFHNSVQMIRPHDIYLKLEERNDSLLKNNASS